MSGMSQSAVIERKDVRANVRDVVVLTSSLTGGVLKNNKAAKIPLDPKLFAQIATIVDSRPEGLLVHRQTLKTRYPQFVERLHRLSGPLSDFIILLEVTEATAASIAVVLLQNPLQKQDREGVIKAGRMAAKKINALSLEASVRIEAWDWHPIPSFTTDLEGRLLSFNKALRSLLGAKKAFSVQHLFGFELVTQLQDRWPTLLKSGQIDFVVQAQADKKVTQVITVNAVLVEDTVILSAQLGTTPKASVPSRSVRDIKRKKGLLWLLRKGQKPILLGEKAEITVGRDLNCDIAIPSDNHSSRIHGRFVVLGDRVKIEDLGSNNGTYVNGRRVSRHVLNHGDRVRIGGTDFLVQSVERKQREDEKSEVQSTNQSTRQTPAAPCPIEKIVTQGDIANKSLVHIFQGISSYSRTCTLKVTWKNYCGQICFIDGDPHSAEIGKLKNLNAAVFMLNLKVGAYVLTDRKPQCKPSMVCGMMKLYMTRIRQADLEKLL